MGLEPFMDCLTNNKSRAFTSFNGWMRIIVKNIKLRFKSSAPIGYYTEPRQLIVNNCNVLE